MRAYRIIPNSRSRPNRSSPPLFVREKKNLSNFSSARTKFGQILDAWQRNYCQILNVCTIFSHQRQSSLHEYMHLQNLFILYKINFCQTEQILVTHTKIVNKIRVCRRCFEVYEYVIICISDHL